MYTIGQFLEFINKCFSTDAVITGSNSTEHANVPCPICLSKSSEVSLKDKKKLAIRLYDHLTKCWVCSYRSNNLYDLIKRYYPHHLEEYKIKFKIASETFYKTKEPSLNDQLLSTLLGSLVSSKGTLESSKRDLEKSFVVLPKGYILLATHQGKGIPEVERACEYLKQRNLYKKEILWYWKLGIILPERTDIAIEGGLNISSLISTDQYSRIYVPSFDSNGSLNYYSARSYYKGYKGRKYLNPDAKKENIIFNELNISWNEELTIVEGVFDLMKANYNATCLLGSSLEKDHLLFKKIIENQTPVLLALDSDMKEKSHKIAGILIEYGIKVRLFQLPNNFHDVGEISGREEFEMLIKNIPEYSSYRNYFYRLYE